MNSDDLGRALSFVAQGTCLVSFGVILHTELQTFKKAPAPKLYIVNVKKHWVALFSLSGEETEAFDSYGRTLTSYSKKFNLILNTIEQENCRQLQQNSSSVCGYFTLMYSFFRSRNVPYCQFLNRFSANMLHNDLLVKNFYNVYIKPNVWFLV